MRSAVRLLVTGLCLVLWGNASAGELSHRVTLPLPETQEVIMDWLHVQGYAVTADISREQAVTLRATRGGASLQLVLRCQSPLATEVYLPREENALRAAPLWTYLQDYIAGDPEPTPAPADPPPAVLARAKSVVCIHARIGEETFGLSGFVLDSQGLILCTAHTLKGLPDITITLSDAHTLPGRIVRLDYPRDLALIKVEGNLGPPLELDPAAGRLELGERLYAFGCPTDHQGIVSPGYINGPPRIAGDETLWQGSMQVQPGSSGSPVFTAKGTLVAVVKGRYRGTDNLGFLIPMDTIIAFVKDE